MSLDFDSTCESGLTEMLFGLAAARDAVFGDAVFPAGFFLLAMDHVSPEVSWWLWLLRGCD